MIYKLSLVFCLLLLLSKCYGFFMKKSVGNSFSSLIMSSEVLSRDYSQAVLNYEDIKAPDNLIYRKPYLDARVSSSAEIGSKLTWTNRLHSDMGRKLKAKYMNLRLLTNAEEITAGKFSSLGKRLEDIKKALAVKLGRQPSDSEWAQSCRLTEKLLNIYLQTAKKARHRLVQHNIKLADHWVRRMIEHTNGGKQVSYFELLTVGVLGLIKAADRYDGRAGFSNYAEFYIRAELYKGISKLRPGAFINLSSIMMNIKCKNMQTALQHQLKRKPTDQEIASKLKINVASLHAVRETASKKVVSAQAQLSQAKGENLVTYLDLFLTTGQAETGTDFLLWKADFLQSLNCLSPAEKRTLTLRYGIFDGRPKSIRKTALMMCVTDEVIRRMIISSLEKLRNSPDSTLLLENNPPPRPQLTTVDGRKSAIAY